MIQETQYAFADRISHIPESFIREILKVSVNPEMISFAGGLPNPECFPVELIAEAAQRVFSLSGKEALQYSVTEGYLPLREYIAERQSKKEGREISVENVLILNGSQQGLDLCGKLFLNQKSKALMEAPTYLGAIQAFSAYQPQFESLSVHEGGPLEFPLREKLYRTDPALFYFVPNFQNPTGYSYNREIREVLAEEALRKDVLLVEDNPYGDLWFSHVPPTDVHGLVPEKTIYLGSFSKIISPGVRIGWAIAPKEIIRKMAIAKQAGDLHTNYLAQRIIFEYLKENSLEDHLDKMRVFYKNQAETMLQLIEKHFPKEVKVSCPTGGMFMWAVLPAHFDTSVLLRKAVRQNVLFVPGEHFFVSANAGKNTLRLNFSNPTGDEMERGIEILGRLMQQNIGT